MGYQIRKLGFKRKKQNKMIKAAKYYLEKGISVIPTGITKSPHHTIKKWVPFQTELMRIDQIEHFFSGASGIATIGKRGSIRQRVH